MATPHVAGVAAVALQQYRNLDAAGLKSFITQQEAVGRLKSFIAK